MHSLRDYLASDDPVGVAMDRLAAVTFLPGVKWGKGVAITLLTQMSRLFQSSNQPSHS